jgi:hypothetical protein
MGAGGMYSADNGCEVGNVIYSPEDKQVGIKMKSKPESVE